MQNRAQVCVASNGYMYASGRARSGQCTYPLQHPPPPSSESLPWQGQCRKRVRTLSSDFITQPAPQVSPRSCHLEPMEAWKGILAEQPK